MSKELGRNWGRKLTATGAAIACAGALAGGLEKPAGAEPASTAGALQCVQFFNFNGLESGKYRACYDYIADAAEGSLQLYYKTAHSRVNYVRDFAKHHLESRYFLGARDTAEHRVASWPKGVNTVHEKVDLLAIATNINAQRALIETDEQWDVIDSQGHNLFHQPEHVEGHTLCRARLPGYVDPDWLVVKNSIDPRFNCLKFAQELTSGKIQ